MLSPPLIRQFWETVNDLYDRPSIHNELTDLILQRIKYQLKFRDSLSPDKIKPQSLLQRMDAEEGATLREDPLDESTWAGTCVACGRKVPSWLQLCGKTKCDNDPAECEHSDLDDEMWGM